MLKDLWINLTARLNSAGDFFALLGLRLILAWEFWESGITKLNGQNWFGSVQEKFPFPFSAFPVEVNWTIAAYGEVIFAILILLGVFTRIAAFSLIVITAVATAAVHWPESWSSLSELWQGYAISDKGYGNFKLPLLFIVMALPLVFKGGGKLSIDYLFNKFFHLISNEKKCDLATIAVTLIVFSVTFIFIMPKLGFALLIVAAITLGIHYFLATNNNPKVDGA